jgi:putative aminopeptidase FrvX
MELLRRVSNAPVYAGTSETPRRSYAAHAIQTDICIAIDGAPTRYMHSTVQMCHMRDVEATIDLLAMFPRYAAHILPDYRR